MKALKKLSAAVLTLSLPLAGFAQTPEPAKPAESAPAAAPAPAPAPPAPAAAPAPAPAPAATADEGVKVTPYGFVLLNAFWDGNALTTHDYPGQAARVNEGGAFLMSARQSRIGMRLAVKDKNWTGADLGGVLEFDFKAGHLATTSTAWYNGVMRLRLAAMTATWNTSYGKWVILAGQEYGLVNPLFAESLAWVADPLFWQAGNLWRRSPQARISYNGQFDMIGLSLAAAILSPADAGTPVDYGYGNRSRTPNFEARAAVSVKPTKDVSGTLGFGYHTGKRRYAYDTPDQKDVTQSLLGLDLDLSLTQFLQVKGEWFQSKGADDTYNTIAVPAVGTTAATGFAKVDGDGFWGQGIIKPIPAVWVTVGYGEANADRGDLTAAGATPGTARAKNSQMEAGLLFNAGKYWRFGVEALKVETKYLDGYKTDATQIAASSQLKF
jgi:hypothetical protein